MTFQPPTIEDVEAYVREKSLAVDHEWFWNFFDAGDWIDTRGNAVKSWKQKLWTHHRMTLERGGMPKCCYSGCKKPAPYIIGKDRDGHPYKYCIDHRPKPKSIVTEEQVGRIFKIVPNDKRSTSDMVNVQIKRLSERKR